MRIGGGCGWRAASLNYLAAFNVHSGAFATAAALTDEVDSITQATGIPPLRYAAATLAAARGDQAPAQALLEWGRRNATERGEGSAVGGALRLAALLHNGHGDYGEALAAGRQACEHEDVVFTDGPWSNWSRPPSATGGRTKPSRRSTA